VNEILRAGLAYIEGMYNRPIADLRQHATDTILRADAALAAFRAQSGATGEEGA
jgi:hypothetical protein